LHDLDPSPWSNWGYQLLQLLVGFLPPISANASPQLGHLMMCEARRSSSTRLNTVASQWAELRKIEVGLSFEPRPYHPARPSVERTGFLMRK
jgi:hypothetical protein